MHLFYVIGPICDVAGIGDMVEDKGLKLFGSYLAKAPYCPVGIFFTISLGLSQKEQTRAAFLPYFAVLDIPFLSKSNQG